MAISEHLESSRIKVKSESCEATALNPSITESEVGQRAAGGAGFFRGSVSAV